MQINIKQFKKWIAALDSGEYRQAVGKLNDPSGKYCCLGVGCRLFIPSKQLVLNCGRISGAYPDMQPAAPIWLQQVNEDFDDKTGMTLSNLNDTGYTFPEIATLLELVYIHKILD
jgi:hypothetical protein